MPASEGLQVVNLADAMEAVRAAGVPMHGAPAEGLPIHSNGHLGADCIHVPANEQFPVHTHPGDHLLLCLQGHGTISVGEVTYSVRPGDLYMVDGLVPHAVGAGSTDHYLVAIGAPHKAVDDPERMSWTDWLGSAVDSPLFASPGPRPGGTTRADRGDDEDAPSLPATVGKAREHDLASYPEMFMFGRS